MNQKTLEIDKAQAIEKAEKLRAELRELCLEFDTDDIEDKLALAVTQYTTPQARRTEIATSIRSEDKSKEESESLRLEYNALERLIRTQEATELRFGSGTAAGVTLGLIVESSDMPTLLNEMRKQAQKLTSKDKKAIKSLLAEQAILAHHVAHHTIYSSRNAPTTEGQAITAKHGVNMLETSSRIVERLSKVDELKHGNIYTKQANIAQNQLIQNGQKVDVIDESSDNAKSENQLMERKDAKRSDLSRLDPRKTEKAVSSDTEMAPLGEVDRAQK